MYSARLMDANPYNDSTERWQY